MGIPDHLTCLLRNLYAGQEATVRTGHGTTDWFQRGKGLRQGCILSPCLFNLYAEYIMRNTGLDEVQAGIKIAGRNINNLRYADDTTRMAESEEEPKSLLMKVKEESEKVGVKLKILQARLQQYVNHELPDVQAGFRKGRGTRDQMANIRWIMERAREFEINIYFCFIDYAKAFDCVDHNTLWKIL